VLHLVATPTDEDDHYSLAFTCDQCDRPIDRPWDGQVLIDREIPQGPPVTVHRSCVGPYVAAHADISIWAGGPLTRLGIDLGPPIPLGSLILLRP